MLHIIWYIIVGFIVGLIARAIMPGGQHLGFIMTTVLGMAGSIVGGLIARLFSNLSQVRRFIRPVSSCQSLARSCCFLFGENWRADRTLAVRSSIECEADSASRFCVA